jgi:phosphoglycerate dehydrogenase-like enzyme
MKTQDFTLIGYGAIGRALHQRLGQFGGAVRLRHLDRKSVV